MSSKVKEELEGSYYIVFLKICYLNLLRMGNYYRKDILSFLNIFKLFKIILIDVFIFCVILRFFTIFLIIGEWSIILYLVKLYYMFI